MNVLVVTPEIAEISRYEITAAATDRIEQAALWLATRSGLAAEGRIGLVGVSFSGGLAVVAAGRSPLRDHLAYVLSIGGHDDLRRVLEYFCQGFERGQPPHDYGVAVGLLNMADRVVPPEQVAPLRAAVRRFLWASYLDVVDKPAAVREFSALRAYARALPEPSATLLDEVNDRDVARLGARLLPLLGYYVDQPALSPSRSPLPTAPVYLLHGREDTVIPATESEQLAARLRGRAPVHLLLTDVLSHVDANRAAGLAEIAALARFWGNLLAE
jgi:dienelactone hydrolase